MGTGRGGVGIGRRKTYVDRGLNAWFGAGALEYNVEATHGLIEGGQSEDLVGDELGTIQVVLER